MDSNLSGQAAVGRMSLRQTVHVVLQWLRLGNQPTAARVLLLETNLAA